MRIENYNITVNCKGQQICVPVKIEENGLLYKVSAMLNDTEICYVRAQHGGLIAVTHLHDYDPGLLYVIGEEIQHQRPQPVCYTE